MSGRPAVDATVVVTGGAGFIGSAVVACLLAETEHRVVTVDCLTYAGNLDWLGPAAASPRHVFVKADVGDAGAMAALFEAHRPEAVLHLAAETHVDVSIRDPERFVRTNIGGTFTLLEAARRYWSEAPPPVRQRFRFVQVSTDEVFGSLAEDGAFDEESPYRPNSPYAASKAAADHLARAWHRTYGLPTIVTHCSNNYGPRQYPEKLIPLTVTNALAGRVLPVYGTGRNVRDWLFVEDHARALLAVLRAAAVGESYAIGGGAERRNIEVVQGICALLDELAPDPGGSHARLIRFVADRPGHDFRYALDSAKIRRELGWRPQESFESGLRRTVEWYLDRARPPGGAGRHRAAACPP